MPARRKKVQHLCIASAALVSALGVLGGCGGSRQGGADKLTEKYLARLKSGDREERESAARFLAQRRGQELVVVPALIAALDDRDPIVRATACEGLRNLLGEPSMSENRSAWEELWRRKKPEYEKDSKLPPQERIKLDRAALENDQGYLYLMRGQFQLAEGYFLEAVALDPRNPKYRNNLGKCRAKMGRWPEAVDNYRSALEEDPSFAPAHFNLAEAYLEISKLTGVDRTYEALGHAEAAMKLDRKGTDWASRWLAAKILFFMAMSEPRATERDAMYKRAGELITEAIRIAEASASAPEIAELHKTAALIWYGNELYYRAYKSLTKVYELGYEMDPDFVSKLGEALRRWAASTGLEAPQMPKAANGAKEKSPPPALRLPYDE